MVRLSTLGAVVTIVALAGTTAPALAASAGSISGTVTNSATAAPIAGVAVVVVDASTSFPAGFAITDSTGAYTIGNLATGTYNAQTSNGLAFIDQIYGGIVCLTCTGPAGGAPISVTDPNPTDHIDFALTPGGRISGSIKDQTGTPITVGVTARVFDAHGVFLSQATPDGSGAYITTRGLPTGTYFIATTNAIGYSDTLYSGIPCSGCLPISGTPISVTAGSTTANINLVLQAAGHISGHVQAAEDGTPINSAFVRVLAPNGIAVAAMSTDPSGNYNLGSIPPGTYFVTADASANGRVVQLYDGKPCQTCSTTLGTPVTVAAGATTPGIDFSLLLGGSISGTVTNASTHAAIPFVNVLAADASGQQVTLIATASDGTYAFNALAPGKYFIRTFLLGGYTDQLHASPANLACPANGCAVALGTAVAVTGTSAVTGIDFALQPMGGGGGTPPTPGRIKGTVTDGTAPLSGIVIQAYPVGNSFFPAGVAVTDVSGAYTLGSLPPGDYILRTTNSIGYINQIYNGHVCQNCTPSSGDVVTVVANADTTNINFALALGARISGRVTDSAGHPIPSVTVLIETRDSVGVSSAATDASGRYVANGLLAGNYVVVTNAPFYVNKMFNDIACPQCYPQTGTVVTVTSGGSAANIDFSLSSAGTIAGTVTDTSGNPLAGVTVSAGVLNSSTNGAGQYVLQGAAPGSYTVTTTNTLGYIDQTSAAVAVIQGSTTTGVDFHLAAGGRIAGTVTSTDGSPLPAVTVRAVTLSGAFAGGATSLSDGSYAINGLAPGTYFVATGNGAGYVDLVHALPSDVQCFGSCAPNQAGAGVFVATNQTATVNFTLPLGGAISGTVTATSGAPIASIAVMAAVPGNGGFFGPSTFTAEDGTYTIVGIPPGAYAVSTPNAAGHISQVYNGHVCLNCNTAVGDLVSVTAGSTHAGVNFALASGASISGTVTDASGAPIAAAFVSIYDLTGGSIAFPTTDSVGHFSSAGLPDGAYYVGAASPGYAATIWPNCTGCTPTAGGQVKVQSGVATPAAANITLPAGGRISGRLTDAITGTPLAGQVLLYHPDGRSAGAPNADANGFYAVDGLASGSYYVYATASSYIPVLYPNVTCVICNLGQGTPVTVVAGNETPGINFGLHLFTGGGTASITGTVTDAATGQPIAGIGVAVQDGQGNFGGVSTTDSSGHYTISGLAAGTYYAGTSGGSALGYVDALFGGSLCSDCFSLTASAPIGVTAGATTPNIDFSLSLAGRVTGRVTSGGAGVGGVFIGLYSTTGTFVAGAASGADGTYGVAAIPPGTYYANTYNTLGLVDQVYGGGPCPFRCVFVTGSTVTVSAGATSAGIDFDLTAGGRISGRATDAATGAPLDEVEVDIYNGVGALVGAVRTDGGGSYLTEEGLTPGNYFVVATSPTFLGNAYIPQVYNAIACAGCSPTSGTPVVVTAGATTVNIDLALTSGSPIAGTVTESGTELPLPGVVINVYDVQARLAASGTTDASGHYATPGLPAGTYFVKANGGTRHVDGPASVWPAT